MLDLTGFILEKSRIHEADVDDAVKSNDFALGVSGYNFGSVPLGYIAYKLWDKVSTENFAKTPKYLIDLIRYTSSCMRLPIRDSRAIELKPFDIDRYKYLYFEPESSINRLVEMIGDFAADSEFRAETFSTAISIEKKVFAEYWVSNSVTLIEKLLLDRRFAAAFDAYRKEWLSYVGLRQKLFGKNVQGYPIFPDIGEVEPFAVRKIVELINEGRLALPERLERDFPDFYKTYMPDVYGED